MQNRRCAGVAMSALVMIGCSDRGPDSPPVPDGGAGDRARLCPPARSAEPIPQRLSAAAMHPMMSYDELRGALVSGCGSCHLAPAITGGFVFQDTYTGSNIRIGGSSRYVQGVSEVASKMQQQLAAQLMPPAALRNGAPEYYARLGRHVQDWIDAGMPQGDFVIPGETIGAGLQLPSEIAAAVTDIGDCVPATELVGHDLAKDAAFAAMTELPAMLTDTDLVSLDAYELARRGTIGYDVEYPLWADNARKGRWIHVPSTMDAGGQPQRTAVAFDPATGRYTIADNTRFYKTFFKAVRESDGVTRYRKIETRLIVVRHAPRQPLFGTYLWDDAEQQATLHALPYRSGQPFKDNVLSFEVDATTHARRTYAVPAAHRCIECHEGSESDSFVLGFTPLQINRRLVGEGGRQTPIEPDEISQLDRLVSYGVIAGMTPQTAPKLENTGGQGRRPRNDYELRMQGYATGNCGHCHNPRGFATRQNARLLLNFLPGGSIFQLGRINSVYNNGTQIVVPSNPPNSVIYKRMLNQSVLEGSVPLLHMPLHTPGLDCDAVQLVGQWITSMPASGSSASPAEIAEALAAAAAFKTACKPAADVLWLEEDFTVPPVYAPRRADWNDAGTGMPASFRNLEFTAALRSIAETAIPNGYWVRKATCKFPAVETPSGGLRPWMVNPDGTPVRPFGEIYYQRPGAAYFTTVCSQCHGPQADGETGLARTILVATGGRTRVANLRDGLFGHTGAALAMFQIGARNLAGNYLIWMAMGATQAFFPPELGGLIGANGPNMLNLVRQSCAQLLPGTDTPMRSSYEIYETYNTVCTFENPITPEVGFVPGTRVPLDPDLQKAWLDHAAQNAGWMIYRFLHEELTAGNPPIARDQCELVYPAN